MPRSRLGPLALESPLGDDPTRKDAHVWRAVHVNLRKEVAVRIFQVAFGGTLQSRQEFATEWDQLKSLDHPGIARCWGGGFEGPEAYLVHEVIEGPTLAAEITRRKCLPWETVLEFAESLTDAIDYLHKQGIVHGRLRADKVIVAGFSPVLLDVRLSDGASPFRTGPYHHPKPPSAEELKRRPPEAPQPQEMVTQRSDLYCLGAIMYEALTGGPPVTGSSLQEVTGNLQFQSPTSVGMSVMDCPVWMDRLVMQLLSKDPNKRPVSADAVKLQLAEVRRRAMSRSGVAEHASSGFSPLNVTDQAEKDQARSLLGRDKEPPPPKRSSADATPWHDQAIFLIPIFAIILGMLVWVAWPLNEAKMRRRAEALLDEGTRSSMSQARISYLEPMLAKFPDGEHQLWAAEQIDRVEMLEAEHALTVKLNRNLPLRSEAERLCAEAMQYEKFGDTATAVDKYQGLVTLMAKEPDYRPLVNLARHRIALLSEESTTDSEASRILRRRLEEADAAYLKGRTISARKIWYSIVELYGSNAAVAPLVSEAQDRLSETSSGAGEQNAVRERQPIQPPTSGAGS